MFTIKSYATDSTLLCSQLYDCYRYTTIQYRGNILSRLFGSSEAFASELLKNIDKMFEVVLNSVIPVVAQSMK